jgi:E3 ubiquitin-protein ligase HUWE1
LEYFSFIGKLISKALLDNITLNLCFNKIIYKIILDEQIKFEDLIFIDKPLYNSLKELKKMKNIENLLLFYVVEYRDENDNLIADELKPNGTNEVVKDINDYIRRRIEYIVTKTKLFANQIRTSLFRVKNFFK